MILNAKEDNDLVKKAQEFSLVQLNQINLKNFNQTQVSKF